MVQVDDEEEDEEEDERSNAGHPTLDMKDYIALAIAALETVFLPLVIVIIVLVALLILLR
jgi:hypothetical protein